MDAESIIEDSIDWYDSNFPQQFPLFHYKYEELSAKTKELINIFKRSIITCFVIQCVNLLDTIISVAGNYFPKINLLYVFLNFFLIMMLHAFTSYSAYVAYIIKEKTLIIRFYIMITINTLMFIAFALINQGCFNGLFRILRYANSGEVGAVICLVLGALESIGYFYASFVCLQLTYFFSNRSVSK